MRKRSLTCTAQLCSSAVFSFLAIYFHRGSQETSLDSCFSFSAFAAPSSTRGGLIRNNAWPAAASAFLQLQPACSSLSCGKRRTIRESAFFAFTPSTPPFRPLLCISSVPACNNPLRASVTDPAASNALPCMPLGNARAQCFLTSLPPLTSHAFLLTRVYSDVFTSAPHQHNIVSYVTSYSSSLSSSAFPRGRKNNTFSVLNTHSFFTHWRSHFFVTVDPVLSLRSPSATASSAFAALWRLPVKAGFPRSTASRFGPPQDVSATRAPAAFAANNAVPSGAACSASSGWCTYPPWLQGVWQVHLRCWGLQDTSENNEAQKREEKAAQKGDSISLGYSTENEKEGPSVSFPTSCLKRERGRSKGNKRSSCFSYQISNVDQRNTYGTVSFDANGKGLEPDEDLPVLLRAFSSISRGCRMHDNVLGEVWSCSRSNSKPLLSSSTNHLQQRGSVQFHNSSCTSDINRRSLSTSYWRNSTSTADVLDRVGDSGDCSPFFSPAHAQWKNGCSWKNNTHSDTKHSLQPWRMHLGTASHLLSPLQQQTLAYLQHIIGTYDLHLEPRGVVRVASRTHSRRQHGTATTAASAADEAAAARGFAISRKKTRPGAYNSRVEAPSAEEPVLQEHSAPQVEHTWKQQHRNLKVERGERLVHAESQAQLEHTSQQQAQEQRQQQFLNVSAAALQHMHIEVQSLPQQKEEPPEQHEEQHRAQQGQLHATQQSFTQASQPSQNPQPNVPSWQLPEGSIPHSQGTWGDKAYRSSIHMALGPQPSGAPTLLHPLTLYRQRDREIEEHQGEVCIPLSWYFTPASHRLVLMLWLPASMLLLRLSTEIRWRGSATCAYEEGPLSLPAAPLPVCVYTKCKKAATPAALSLASSVAVSSAAPGGIPAVLPVVTPAAAVPSVAVPAAAAVPSVVAPAAALAAGSGTRTDSQDAPAEIASSAAHLDGGAVTVEKQACSKITDKCSSPLILSRLTVRLQPCTSTMQHQAESVPSSATNITAAGRSNTWRRIPNGVWGRGFLYACDHEWADSGSNSCRRTEGSWPVHTLPQQKLRSKQGEEASLRRQQHQRSSPKRGEDWLKQEPHENILSEVGGSTEAERHAEKLESMHQQGMHQPDGVQQTQVRECSDMQYSTLQQSQHWEEQQNIWEKSCLPSRGCCGTLPHIRKSGGAALLGEVYMHLTRAHRHTSSTRATTPPLLPKRGFLLLKTRQQRHVFLQELRALQQIQLQYLRHWLFSRGEQQLDRGDVKLQPCQQQESQLKRQEQSQQHREEEEQNEHSRMQCRHAGPKQQAQDTERKQKQEHGKRHEEKTLQMQEGQQQPKDRHQEYMEISQTQEHRMVGPGDKYRRQQEEQGRSTEQVLVVHRRPPQAVEVEPLLTTCKECIACVRKIFTKRECRWFAVGGLQSRPRTRGKGRGMTAKQIRTSNFRSGNEVALGARVSVVTVAVEGKVVGWTLPPPALPAAAIDCFSVAAACFTGARGPIPEDLPPLLVFEEAEKEVAVQEEEKGDKAVVVAKEDNCAALKGGRQGVVIVKGKAANDFPSRAGVEREEVGKAEAKGEACMPTHEKRLQKQVQQDVAAALLHPAVQRKLGFSSVDIAHAVYVQRNRLVNFILGSSRPQTASPALPRLLDVSPKDVGTACCT